MQHLIKTIANNYANISELRKDKKRFTRDGFINFAKDNMVKFNIFEEGGELYVTTFFSDDLVEAYKKTI